MRERQQSHLVKQRDRLTYGAVPLEPWTAAEETGRWLRKRRETYLAASVLRIHDASQVALIGAIEQGWVESPDLAKQLHGVIETSLYDSQSRRMDLNPGKLEHGMVDEDDPRYEKAKNGTATPGELVSLLIDYPKLSSLEIAKLTHPLDIEATTEMDSEVMYTLAYMGFEFVDEPGRYKTKTKRPDIPAITVLRKQTVGQLEAESGTVQVVRRQAFLVAVTARQSAKMICILIVWWLARAVIMKFTTKSRRACHMLIMCQAKFGRAVNGFSPLLLRIMQNLSTKLAACRQKPWALSKLEPVDYLFVNSLN